MMKMMIMMIMMIMMMMMMIRQPWRMRVNQSFDEARVARTF